MIFGSNDPWYHDIYTYYCDKILPPNLFHTQHKYFIQFSLRFTILDDTTYQIMFDGSLLRFFNSKEGDSHWYLWCSY